VLTGVAGLYSAKFKKKYTVHFDAAPAPTKKMMLPLAAPALAPQHCHKLRLVTVLAARKFFAYHHKYAGHH
jgi:hypothetical protein